jgi:hypothetical protein
MSSRFRYEPKTIFQKLATRLKHPRQWRAKITPCIFDNASGARFQLACDDRLNVRMPGDKEWPLSPVTLDDVAIAVMRRRTGYVFDWTRVASIETQRRSR